jgi:hypothetical protein
VDAEAEIRSFIDSMLLPLLVVLDCCSLSWSAAIMLSAINMCVYKFKDTNHNKTTACSVMAFSPSTHLTDDARASAKEWTKGGKRDIDSWIDGASTNRRLRLPRSVSACSLRERRAWLGTATTTAKNQK